MTKRLLYILIYKYANIATNLANIANITNITNIVIY